MEDDELYGKIMLLLSNKRYPFFFGKISFHLPRLLSKFDDRNILLNLVLGFAFTELFYWNLIELVFVE